MSLIGVVDPSHRVSRTRVVGTVPPWVSLDRALELSMEDPKWSPWPWELLNALFSEYQDRGDNITSSSLVSHCPRAQVLARREDYVEELRALYIPFRGTMVHRTLEAYAHAEAIAEHRFYTKVGGIEVSCAPDHFTRTVLSDYKVTENPPMYSYPWADHSEQVQFNAFIVRNATAFSPPGTWAKSKKWDNLPFDPRNIIFDRLQLVYLGPKWPKVLSVEKTVDGKKQPDIWDDKFAARLIGSRAAKFQQALESYPEWPEGLELSWGGNPGWECPGSPLCEIPGCLAKRYPGRLVW